MTRLLATLAMIGAVLALGGPARATSIGPDAYGYTASDVGYAWVDISATGAPGLTSDADAFTSADLGFTFTFYGQGYTKVYWSINGLMTFGAGSTQYTNQDLASSTSDKWTYDGPSIAPLWDDWESSAYIANDGTYHQTTGTAGNQQFIVQWNLLRHEDDGGDRSEITFQAILLESSGAILFKYNDVAVGHTGIDNGKSATVGIRDTGGAASGRNLQWSCNKAVIANGTAIRFAPIPEPATAAGLMLGIGGLARYIRRRHP